MRKEDGIGGYGEGRGLLQGCPVGGRRNWDGLRRSLGAGGEGLQEEGGAATKRGGRGRTAWIASPPGALRCVAASCVASRCRTVLDHEKTRTRIFLRASPASDSDLCDGVVRNSTVGVPSLARARLLIMLLGTTCVQGIPEMPRHAAADGEGAGPHPRRWTFAVKVM